MRCQWAAASWKGTRSPCACRTARATTGCGWPAPTTPTPRLSCSTAWTCPGAGPDGTDLAIFHYEADGAGTATLRFGLVPAGRTLIGPEDTRVEDPAAFPAYSATVAVP